MSDGYWDLMKLSKGEWSALRNNVGLSLANSSIAAQVAYFHAAKSQEIDDVLLSCMCMDCLWRPEDSPQIVPMERLMRHYYKNNEVSKSKQNQIIAILDIPMSDDGYLIRKLVGFARYFYTNDKGIKPDFKRLVNDLYHWNDPDKIVQSRWIRMICT